MKGNTCECIGFCV